jgi:hypothetical protein
MSDWIFGPADKKVGIFIFKKKKNQCFPMEEFRVGIFAHAKGVMLSGGDKRARE